MVDRIIFEPMRFYYNDEKKNTLLDYSVKIAGLSTNNVTIDTEIGQRLSVAGIVVFLSR